MTITEAARVLKKGGLIAYPTETFYGLGADPRNIKAVEKIFKIKKRDQGKPISLILSSTRQLDKWARGVGRREKEIIRKFWPGPLTLVFKSKKSVPKILTAGTGKIALRVPNQRDARQLAGRVGGAITATSANRSGKSATGSPSVVYRQLGREIDGLVGKRTLKRSKGSTILDLTTKSIRVLRQGQIKFTPRKARPLGAAN